MIQKEGRLSWKQHKIEHRKGEGSYYSAAPKAEESRKKIESGSIEQLRRAESRQEKKAESRSIK